MKKNFSIALFLFYFLLASGIGIYVSATTSEIKMLALHIAHGFTLAWIFTFLNDFLPYKSLRAILNSLLITVLSLSFLTDIFCVAEFNSTFTEDFIALVLGSDPAESSEFLELHYKGFLLGICVWGLLLGCFLLLRKFPLNLPRMAYLASSLLLIPCLLLININPDARRNLLKYNSAEGKIYMMSDYIRNAPPDFRDFIHPANLEVVADQPENIVIVFGESHCRNHCQFFGYDKETMPDTQRLIDEGHITAFGNVSAPDINTQKAFKSLMSTYIPEFGDSVLFYTCQTLPQIIREAGYHSTWISNQSKRGFYDNIIGNFADLCDTTIFNGDKFSGMLRKNPDGELLPVLDSIVRADSSRHRNFYVVHLMGSHPGFHDRYPDGFEFFHETDYPLRPAPQRFYFATYDNSLRYTDHVLSEIIRRFQDKETILLYLSDHGLDFYVTQDDYCAHAITRDTESGKASMEIPFLIYTSDLYQQHFPSVCTRIRDSKEREYRTDSLIYTVMDIAGVVFKDPAENHSSLLHDAS